MDDCTDAIDNLRAWRGDYQSAAPQDWAAEVLPVEHDIQVTLDTRLRIVWHPKALIARPLVRSATGAIERPTEYAGRYQVVIAGALDGELTALHTVGSELGPEKPYRAIGPWLVEFLRVWDAQNMERAQEMAKMVAEQADRIAAQNRLSVLTQREQLTRYATDVLKMTRNRVAVATQIE